MFEKHLQSKLAIIFDLPKTSYDMASDINEQECLFIEIKRARVKITDGMFTAKVDGECVIWAQNTKLPFGYLSKQIQRAPREFVENFFFYDIEDGKKVFGNIVMKSFKFVFFYEGQYDPSLGEINSVEFENHTYEVET